MIKSLALAGFLTLAAAPAFADALLTATLQQPVSKPVQFIASDALWNCAGSSCTSSTAPDRAYTASGCRELSRQVGAVSIYGDGHATLGAPQLDKCNAGLAKVTTTASAH